MEILIIIMLILVIYADHLPKDKRDELGRTKRKDWVD